MPASVGEATLAEWERAVQRQGGEADYSEVIRHLEQDANAFVRSTSAAAVS